MSNFIEKLKSNDDLQKELETAVFDAINKIAKGNGGIITKDDISKHYANQATSHSDCIEWLFSASCTW